MNLFVVHSGIVEKKSPLTNLSDDEDDKDNFCEDLEEEEIVVKGEQSLNSLIVHSAEKHDSSIMSYMNVVQPVQHIVYSTIKV